MLIPSYNWLSWSKSELTKNDYDVLIWMKDNIPTNATIASTWQVSGAWIPTVAERGGILGTYQEAVPDYLQRREDLKIIFSSENREEIEIVLKEYNAEYIYINSLEDELIYNTATVRLGGMFTEIRGNEYAHLFKT